MRTPVSAQLWRAAALALAAGWVVMACGGGGEEAEGASRHATAPAPQPPPMNTAAAAAPCPSNLPSMAPVGPVLDRPDTAALEREFSASLRAEMAAGMASGAGTVEMPDPFEPQ